VRNTLLAIALLVAADAAQASIAFVTPLEGAQVVGPAAIEITAGATAVDRVEFRVDGVLVGVRRQPPYRIAFDFGTSPASRRIAARVFWDGYRSVEEVTINTAALTSGESITVDLVEVPMRVRSARTVTAQDLRVRENATEQAVREVKAERGPAHFAFVVDRSLSMGGGKLEAALRAVREGMTLLRPGDTSSVVLFNHTVDRPLTPASLGRIVPSGGTALRDAVAAVASTKRTYAIVITDGGDRSSLLSEEEALRKISGTKTMLTAIVLGERGSFLERATRNTGGSLLRSRDLSAAVRQAITDINSRYLLVYQSHGTGDGWRSISVTPRRAGIEVLAARKGYFAE
jgi:hypothetical protein